MLIGLLRHSTAKLFSLPTVGSFGPPKGPRDKGQDQGTVFCTLPCASRTLRLWPLAGGKEEIDVSHATHFDGTPIDKWRLKTTGRLLAFPLNVSKSASSASRSANHILRTRLLRSRPQGRKGAPLLHPFSLIVVPFFCSWSGRGMEMRAQAGQARILFFPKGNILHVLHLALPNIFSDSSHNQSM
jgi:hypothetical protein